ncbi:GNAT family N-acetyltransferase [Saccharococcus caldoxylosilyticus]|uniref:GNAT family N-acetyltransferase n=1 Tax=Saccharococcus caldoxylosilyticus TaxID=81408 RepID=UPI0002F90971|nr:GNAT family N-acetyltransferase [Parageobacillus caldoxylosilyticus]
MQYQLYEGMPPEDVIEQIMNLYETIFQTSSENIRNKMQKVDRLLVLVALDNGKVVGFKLGYEQGANEFYSWIGGVDSAYRRQGIGSTLMTMQHDWLKEHGYSVVTTTTKNKWRNMLILNLRHGFDIIGTYTDEKGEPKIILKKQL